MMLSLLELVGISFPDIHFFVTKAVKNVTLPIHISIEQNANNVDLAVKKLQCRLN